MRRAGNRAIRPLLSIPGTMIVTPPADVPPSFPFWAFKCARIETLIGLSLTTLTGCPGMGARDSERFQALVARKVSPGMPFVTAIKKLVKAGFSCDDRCSAPLVTCTLDRQSVLPYACIERVDLTTDAEPSRS